MEISLDKNENNNSIQNRNYFVQKNINNIPEYNSKIYDKQILSVIDKLSNLITKFHFIFKKLINDIYNISITLGNQTFYSKTLLLEINKSNDKYFQLNDRIEMITDTKNLLDNNLSVANNNLNIFISEAKRYFMKLKKLKNKKIIQSYEMNHQKNNLNSASSSRDKINKDVNINFNSIEPNFEEENMLINNHNLINRK